MRYKKGKENILIIQNIKGHSVPATDRSWKLIFHSTKTNIDSTYAISDVSPFPDSYHEFHVDDNVINLSIGTYILKVYEVDTGDNEYLYCTLNVIVEGSLNQFIEYAQTQMEVKYYEG